MAPFDIVKKGGQAPARLAIDHLDPAELEQFRRAGTIIADPKRRRPRYFDGRFLAAPDLTREQDYFIARQADLTRASGAGVLHGLEVARLFGDDSRVTINRGNGVTPSGDLVVLTDDIQVDLADVAEMQRLDKAFALDIVPNEPPRRRTGIFVLALRSIEYTANPITAYPSSIAERRAVDDGEIIEGVAVTLIPYRDDHTELDPQQQRGHVARRVFLEQGGGLPSEALPIAMLQLDRGFLLWLDPWLARREIGAEHAGVTGFALTPRAVREAHVQQYNGQMETVIAERLARGLGPSFQASGVFSALPAAGYMPLHAVFDQPVQQSPDESQIKFTQVYFPPQIQVSMAMVPPDEIPALVEESLILPPIDLSGPAEALDYTSVVILLPVWRYLYETFRDSLAREVERAFTQEENRLPLEERRALLATRVESLMTLDLAPAAPGILTRRQPVNVFRRLMPAMVSTMARERLARSTTTTVLTPISTTPISTSDRLAPVLTTDTGIARAGTELTSTTIGPFRSGLAVRRAAAVSDAAAAAPPAIICPPWYWAFSYFLNVFTLIKDHEPVLWYVRRRTLHVAPDAAPLRAVLNLTEV